jgi:hypothetical protein
MLIFRTFMLLAAVMLPAHVSAAGSMTVTATAERMQTVEGFGLNVIRHPSYVKYNEENRRALARTLWKEGHFNCLRLWDQRSWRGQTDSVPIARDMQAYVESHIIGDALDNGVNFVVLETNGCGAVQSHTGYYANKVRDLKANGIMINGIGFRNKPNTTGSSGRCRWSPAEVVEGVKLLRKKLDSLGCADVKIVAPETVEWFPRPSDSHAEKYNYEPGDDSLYLSALVKDPEAIRSIAAFGTQTYGKGITAWMQDLARPFNKGYWVTICALDPQVIGVDTVPAPGDSMNKSKGPDLNYLDSLIAPVTAAQCLSDLNHGMTRWFGWAWSNYIDIDDSQSIRVKPRYYFMQTVAGGFDPGALMRRCVRRPASPGADMHFNAGQEPSVVVAAGRNPDSTVCIALVNLRGVHAQHYASVYDPATAASCTVAVVVDEVSGKDSVPFVVKRCHGTKLEVKDEGVVMMRKKSLRIILNPLDLVVLRSASAVALAPSRTNARAGRKP